MVFVPGMVNGVLGWHLNPEPTGWKAQTTPLSYGCPTLFFERLKAKQIEWRGGAGNQGSVPSILLHFIVFRVRL